LKFRRGWKKATTRRVDEAGPSSPRASVFAPAYIEVPARLEESYDETSRRGRPVFAKGFDEAGRGTVEQAGQGRTGEQCKLVKLNNINHRTKFDK